jgi:serine acetyltransferase
MKKISKVINRVAWISLSKTFKHVGKNSHVEEKFSIIGSQYISIGDDFSGGRNLKIHAFDIDDLKKPMIIIGNDVTITDNCYISAAGEITIGNGTLLGENTFVCDNFHGGNTIDELETPPNDRKIIYKGAVNIGRNVWIGRNVCIMPGISIGEGSVIGANAVVTHSIPDHCIAAGVPARVIKTIHH